MHQDEINQKLARAVAARDNNNDKLVDKDPPMYWVEKLVRSDIIWLVKERRCIEVVSPWSSFNDKNSWEGMIGVRRLAESKTSYLAITSYGRSVSGEQIVLPCKGVLRPKGLTNLDNRASAFTSNKAVTTSREFKNTNNEIFILEGDRFVSGFDSRFDSRFDSKLDCDKLFKIMTDISKSIKRYPSDKAVELCEPPEPEVTHKHYTDYESYYGYSSYKGKYKSSYDSRDSYYKSKNSKSSKEHRGKKAVKDYLEDNEIGFDFMNCF